MSVNLLIALYFPLKLRVSFVNFRLSTAEISAIYDQMSEDALLMRKDRTIKKN